MRDFEWPTGVHIKVLEPLMKYTIDYDDTPDLELHLAFDAIMPPNPHPVGVAPFIKGTHLDQAGRVTGEVVLRGERIPIDCYSVRDRSWGPRPMGRPKKRATDSAADRANARAAAGGIGYSFGVAGPRDAWLTYSLPRLDHDPLSCGFLLRDGKYAHIITGDRTVAVDPVAGWPTHIEIRATDDAGRELAVSGDAVSRHWRGNGGDSLFRWQWDGLEGWGEDQSYLSTRSGPRSSSRHARPRNRSASEQHAAGDRPAAVRRPRPPPVPRDLTLARRRRAAARTLRAAPSSRASGRPTAARRRC